MYVFVKEERENTHISDGDISEIEKSTTSVFLQFLGNIIYGTTVIKSGCAFSRCVLRLRSFFELMEKSIKIE